MHHLNNAMRCSIAENDNTPGAQAFVNGRTTSASACSKGRAGHTQAARHISMSPVRALLLPSTVCHNGDPRGIPSVSGMTSSLTYLATSHDAVGNLSTENAHNAPHTSNGIRHPPSFIRGQGRRQCSSSRQQIPETRADSCHHRRLEPPALPHAERWAQSAYCGGTPNEITHGRHTVVQWDRTLRMSSREASLCFSKLCGKTTVSSSSRSARRAPLSRS